MTIRLVLKYKATENNNFFRAIEINNISYQIQYLYIL